MIPDARIDQRIQQVDQQRRRSDRKDRNENHAREQIVIRIVDRSIHQLPDARIAEYDFAHERTTERTADVQRQRRHLRQDRIAEHVAITDRMLRQARSMALTIREREFVNTARFSGESTLKIVCVEIVPHVLSWAMANFVNTILVAIGSEASLAVLGLSSTTTPTLGNMIYWARQYQAIMKKQWIWIGSPVLATSILFIGLFLTYTGYNEYVAKKRGR